MIIDTHAHYDDKRYNKDRDSILQSLPKEGILSVINIGADIRSVKMSIALAQKYPHVYATIGVHPHYVKHLKPEDEKFLEEVTKNKKVVAVGEIGLDYYRDLSPRDQQMEWFLKQIEIARRNDLPLVIHTRDATNDTYTTLKASKMNKGVIHAYSGSVEMAEKFVDLGFHLGIGGVLTYKNVKQLPEVIKAIPLEYLVLETDAPYLTPEPMRGKRNMSQYLTYVVDKISEIKQISTDTVEEKTTENAKKLFSLA